jgi:hypothetical protein
MCMVKRNTHWLWQKKSHYHRLSARRRLTKAGGLASAALFQDTPIQEQDDLSCRVFAS